jgi:hypothetical protein
VLETASIVMANGVCRSAAVVELAELRHNSNQRFSVPRASLMAASCTVHIQLQSCIIRRKQTKRDNLESV